MNMQIKEAKQLFEKGVIVTFRGVPDPFNLCSWGLLMETKKHDFFELQTVRGKAKRFKTVDALLADVRLITGRVSGFIVFP
jgi:hypothetical protein